MDFWPRTILPKSPGRYLKFQKRSEDPLVDKFPTKRFRIEKGGLSDLLPVEILSIVDEWSISFEYKHIRITVTNKIIQKKTIFYKLPYTKLKPFHNFIPLSLYSTTRSIGRTDTKRSTVPDSVQRCT